MIPSEVLQQHPQLEKFAKNPRVLEALTNAMYPKNDITGVKEKDNVSNAELLIASLWSTSSMVCCPVCGSKLDSDIGVQTRCLSLRCKKENEGEGREVVSVRKPIQRLYAGDINGNVAILNFFPSTLELDDETANGLVGKVVRVTGKVGRLQKSKDGSEMPNIAVKTISVAYDATSKNAPLPAYETTTTQVSTPAPSPNPSVPPEKLAKLKGFMYAMSNQTRPEDLQKYVETTVGLKFSDIENLFERTDTSSGQFLKLKGLSLEQLKEEIKRGSSGR